MLKPVDPFELSEETATKGGVRFFKVICGVYPSLAKPILGGVLALEVFMTASGLEFR